MKMEIVVRLPAEGGPTDWVLAEIQANTIEAVERQLSETFTELGRVIPEQWLLDRLEEEL